MQNLFEFFQDEHGLILTEGEMSDIIHEVKQHIKFQETIEDAFDEGVDDEYNHHINLSDRIYMNGRHYYEKTFKTI